MKWFSRRLDDAAPRGCLLIGCSDATLPATLPGLRGRVMRVASTGNVVPPAEEAAPPVATLLAHAIEGRGVEDIIICGHTGCEALRGMLAPAALAPTEEHRAWYAHAARTRSIVREHYLDLTPEAMFEAAVQEHVLVQLENLLTHPVVASAASAGRLKVHGWVFDGTTDRLLAYDPGTCQFHPVVAPVPQPPRRP